MAAPTNTTAATALALSTWGDYVIPDVNLLSAPYELWFTFTTAASEYVVGLWSMAPQASIYDPIFIVYTGTVGSLTALFTPTTPNRPSDVPVTPSTQYWVRVRQVGASVPNASLTFRLVKAASGLIPVGSILIPDVSDGFRMAAISGVDGSVLGYVPFPAGESGIVLADGTTAIEDSGANNIKIYAPDLTTIVATVAIDLNGNGQINSNAAEDAFLIAQRNGVSPASVSKVSASGSVVWTRTMPLVSIAGAALSPDESIIYWIQNTSANQPVRRFDVAGNAALSDLAAGIASTSFRRGVIVLPSDGSVLISYLPNTGSQYIRRYSAAGTVVNTYTRYPTATRSIDRITLDITAGHFWLWEQTTNTHYLTLIRASDGAEIRVLQVPVTQDGEIQQSSDTAPIFGASWSCPLLVSRATFVIPTPPNPSSSGSPATPSTVICDCVPPTGSGPPTTPPPGGTTSPPPITNPPPLEVTIGEQISCDGGGLVPIQADFEPSELWWAA